MTTLPPWNELPETTRGCLVRFFRTAELESSFDYAAENFPPELPENSPLLNVDPGKLSDIYWGDYQALGTDEFWHLYNLA